MDLTTAALLSAMLRAGSGSLQDPIHEEVLNAIRKRKDGMLAAAKLQSFCEKHDKDSLPRVRFWVRAFEALGDCKTASDVNALFASNLTNYVRDYLDRQETRSVNAMRNLFYGSCAITCFGFATQKAFDDAAAEVKAAAAAATAAATSKMAASAEPNLIAAVVGSVNLGCATRRAAVAALVAACPSDALDSVRFWVTALEEAESCHVAGDASATFDTWERQFWLDCEDEDEPDAAEAVRELFFRQLWKCSRFRRDYAANRSRYFSVPA